MKGIRDFLSNIAATYNIVKLNALSSKKDLAKLRCGAYSSESFLSLADIVWKQAVRDEMCISTLIVDVEDFGDMCNKYGLLACEEILAKISGIILQNVRRPLDLTGRYRRSVYAVLLYSASLKAANRIADRINNEIKQQKFQRVGFVDDIVVNVQIGVATNEKPSLETSFEDLLKEAENGFCGARKDNVCTNCANNGKGICV
ncbi:MAG: diguanylate cyclase [Chitinivibrionia bacterium]|nr:diguanylate cyclase [Chitinivibrionia bacterium]